MAPIFSKMSVRAYHGFTRGFILNEIVRRVDSEGRTVGEFLRAEIAKPLGLNMAIGAEKEELDKGHPLLARTASYTMLQSLKRAFMGRKTELGVGGVLSLLRMVAAGEKEAGFDETAVKPYPFINMTNGASDKNVANIIPYCNKELYMTGMVMDF